jgi:AcrR family transcriptional regulator
LTKHDAELPEKLIAMVIKDIRAGRVPKMSSITKELGVSAPLVNHHFGDSAALLTRAWREIILSSVAEDYLALDALAQRADVEGLSDFIYEVFNPERHANRLAHMRAVSESLADHEIREVVLEAQELTRQSWVNFLTKHTESGVFVKRVDINAMALLFAAIPLGITAARLDLDEIERRQVSDAWLTIVLAMLQPGYKLES